MAARLTLSSARPTPPVRWACTSAAVSCRRCHHEWDDGDPAYALPCRGCGADTASPCERPGGGNERACHQRDQDATRAGLLEPCEGLSWDRRHDKPLPLFTRPVPQGARVRTGAPPSRVFG
ncbi:hypothetical protein J2D73_10760 [Acetobacter sacchari]|uniref:Uncharacterized protein n=1 Tax=Acetobacter sacchari TaxID=2661687 RepID=A0ABS3LWI7_9PROT|nr:hypothetical protein [Acetobacter sacchari]MBO1360267.1 hypothetical protein [Acetobacter sacchari]